MEEKVTILEKKLFKANQELEETKVFYEERIQILTT